MQQSVEGAFDQELGRSVDVASSRIRMRGSARSARVIETKLPLAGRCTAGASLQPVTVLAC